jgi:hypothetical protein
LIAHQRHQARQHEYALSRVCILKNTGQKISMAEAKSIEPQKETIATLTLSRTDERVSKE